MKDMSYENKIIGAEVMSTPYGIGHVTRFVLRDDDKYYISVLFEDYYFEKTFMASLAFSKHVIKLSDEELNRRVNLLLQNHEMRIKNNLHSIEAQDNKCFSPNDSINELIKKVLKGEQIAVDLITVYEDDAFEKDLCEEAFLYLERVMAGGKAETAHKACIVCALALIAQKYYDGDLHSYIEKKYREYMPLTERNYSRAAIQNGVYKAIGGFRKRVKYFDSNSYVAVPLVLSCVPHYRLKDLFRISYDIYKQKLLFDEDLSDSQIEEKVSEAFASLRRKDLIADAEKIKGTNYLMSKYTQSCIYSGFGIDTLSKIVTHCIRLIIYHLSRPEDSFVVDPFYSEGYTTWRKAFEADEKEKNKYEANRTISQPKLKLINTSVHLITGELSMDEGYDPNNVHLCVYQRGLLVEDKLITDPNAIEFAGDDSAISGYIIRRQEIPVSVSPIGELSYTIECDGQMLYDSKTRLHRTAVFFDGKGNEVKPGTNYTGDIFILTKQSLKEEYGGRVKEEYQESGYILSVIEVNEQEVFHFDNEPYIFYKVSSVQLISYAIPWGEFISAEGKFYPVYSDVTVLFPSSGDREDICLEVDGKQYYYGDGSDLDFRVRLFSNEHGDNWVYSLKIFNLDPGFHTIRIFNALSGKQIKGSKFDVVYDPDIWKSFVSKDSLGITYNVYGSFIENQELLYEFGATAKELHAFVKNLGYGSLSIYPSSISYSIDGSTWLDIDRKFYLCEIPVTTKTIQLCGPRKMSAFLIDQNASVKKQMLSLETNPSEPSLYKLHLSLLRALNGKKSAKISFEYGNHSKNVLIWYNPYVLKDECQFYFDEESQKYTFDIRFEGTSTVQVTITALQSNDVIVTKEITSGEIITISPDTIASDVKYISISIHGRKYGSLFNRYQIEPYFCFPKFDLGRKTVNLTNNPLLSIKKGILSGKLEFEGASEIVAKIIPNGFSTPLLSKTVFSGYNFKLDVSLLPFNAYQLYLYQHAVKGDSSNELPFYKSKTIKTESPFLKRIFSVSSFILKDGSRLNTQYTIRIFAISEINGKYSMRATLKNKNNGTMLDEIYVFVEKELGLQYIVKLRRRIKESFIRLTLSSGKIIEGAVIEKLGDWK